MLALHWPLPQSEFFVQRAPTGAPDPQDVRPSNTSTATAHLARMSAILGQVLAPA
jgi:hypothetical protein